MKLNKMILMGVAAALVLTGCSSGTGSKKSEESVAGSAAAVTEEAQESTGSVSASEPESETKEQEDSAQDSAGDVGGAAVQNTETPDSSASESQNQGDITAEADAAGDADLDEGYEGDALDLVRNPDIVELEDLEDDDVSSTSSVVEDLSEDMVLEFERGGTRAE